MATTMRDAFGPTGDLGSLRGDIQNDLKAISGPLAVPFVLNQDIPQNPMANYYMGACSNNGRYGDPVNEMLAYSFVLALLREVRPDASGGIAAVSVFGVGVLAVGVLAVGVVAVAERASG